MDELEAALAASRKREDALREAVVPLIVDLEFALRDPEAFRMLAVGRAGISIASARAALAFEGETTSKAGDAAPLAEGTVGSTKGHGGATPAGSANTGPVTPGAASPLPASGTPRCPYCECPVQFAGRFCSTVCLEAYVLRPSVTPLGAPASGSRESAAPPSMTDAQVAAKWVEVAGEIGEQLAAAERRAAVAESRLSELLGNLEAMATTADEYARGPELCAMCRGHGMCMDPGVVRDRLRALVAKYRVGT